MQEDFNCRKENDEIPVLSDQLLEFVPVIPGTFNNAWKLQIDRFSGRLRLERIFKISWILGAVSLPMMMFIIAILVACYAKNDLPVSLYWGFVFFLIFLGCAFAIAGPASIAYGLHREKKPWPVCRFEYLPDTDEIVVAERIRYKRSECKEIAFAVISGYRGAHGQYAVATQLHFLVLMPDDSWRKHILAIEGFSGRIRYVAKALANHLNGSVLNRSMSPKECNAIRKKFSNQLEHDLYCEIHRYVGIYSPAYKNLEEPILCEAQNRAIHANKGIRSRTTFFDLVNIQK